MTVFSIETVQALIVEGGLIDSVWEYTNRMNNKKMFAVFMANQYIDVLNNLNIKDPELIWTEGKFLGEYEHLN